MVHKNFVISGENEKGKQYFGRVLLLRSVSSHIWANYLKQKLLTPVGS